MVNCIAIDDDPLFLKMLSSYFSQINFAKLIGTYTNPVNGVLAVVKLKPAILLLDLQMPYLNGLEALETLDNIPKIIVISGSRTLDTPLQFAVSKFMTKTELNSPKVLEEAINSIL